MDTNTIFSGAINSLTKRYLGPFFYRYKWLEKTQWLEYTQIEKLQTSLLNKLLRHCYNTVPYYNNLMKKLHISVERTLPLEIIKEFPILTKDDVRVAGSLLVSQKYPKWLLHTAYTGGSTGPRLPLYRDIVSIGNEHAFIRRQFDWAGIKMSDRCAYLSWRTVKKPNDHSKRFYAYDPFMKELILSTFHLTTHNIYDYIEAMKAYKIQAIVGYPSAIFAIAKELNKKKQIFRVRAVLTTSEMLDAEQRWIIERSFNCPVYDYYGGAERVCYIHTCEKGRYHIIPEYGLTELLPCEKPNEDCNRVVATGFWNYAMPLLRYNTGDLIRTAASTCECGRAFRTVDFIIGRESKPFKTKTGRVIGLTAMARLLKNVLLKTYRMNIDYSRFLIDKKGKLVFEYICTEEVSTKIEIQIDKVITEELPSDMDITVRRVSRFDRTPSGKIISLVQA